MASASEHTVLVTGATGTTGSALLRVLDQQGVPVRAMVHHPSDVARLGDTSATVLVANFDDVGSIERALEGVDSVYLVTPSSVGAETQEVQFAELAKRAQVKHLVKLSQFGASEACSVRFLRYHAMIEQRIRDLGVGYTILRPNFFFQGLLAFRELIEREGRLIAPIGDARISAIDVRDIADVAAAVLTQPGHLGKTYHLTGPAAVTHAEIAAELSKALGREVSFADVPPETFAEALRGIGMRPWQVDGYLEDYADYARGEAAVVTPTVRELTGHEPRDLATFASDFAEAFAAAEEPRRTTPYEGARLMT